MPLTDPELDLLMENLAEDPASGPFLQVGEELLRRSRWDEAVEVLWNGLAQDPDPQGWEWLARAALEAGRYDVARAALIEVDRDPRTNPEVARIEILVMERSGRLEQARICAERFLQVDPNDVVVTSVLERLDAPPPASTVRAADPFYTVDRAERYVEVGRADRALRVFRRILLANPGDPGIELRIRQLITAPSNIEDDLSAELTDPGMVPPDPDMGPEMGDSDAMMGLSSPPIAKPTPRLATPPGVPRRELGSGQGARGQGDRGQGNPEELPTDVPAPVRGRLPGSLETTDGMDPDELPTQRMELTQAMRRLLQEEDTPNTPDDPDQRGRKTLTR